MIFQRMRHLLQHSWYKLKIGLNLVYAPKGRRFTSHLCTHIHSERLEHMRSLCLEFCLDFTCCQQTRCYFARSIGLPSVRSPSKFLRICDIFVRWIYWYTDIILLTILIFYSVIFAFLMEQKFRIRPTLICLYDNSLAVSMQ